MSVLLVVGTDTNVGKTVLVTALAAYWEKYYSHKSLGLMKLLQTGVGDCEHYQTYFDASESITLAETICFEEPLAPPLAASREGREIPLQSIWQTLSDLKTKQDYTLVEALGGLGSPVTQELTVAELAQMWRLETVLLVPVKLGAIGQAVANVALARQYQLRLRGIILSCFQPTSMEQLESWAPSDLIESLTRVPVLGMLPYFSNLGERNTLVQAISGIDLERLLSL